MNKYLVLMAFLFPVTCALQAQELPIKCDISKDDAKKGDLQIGEDGCRMTYFDRTENKIWRGMNDKPKKGPGPITKSDWVTIIRGSGTKVLYSGTILEARYDVKSPLNTAASTLREKDSTLKEDKKEPWPCSRLDWRVVVMAKESSNILVYGPADVSEFCLGDSDYHVVIVLPVTVIWAELYHREGNLKDPFRKPPGPISKAKDPYCDNHLDNAPADLPFVEATDIRPCDRYSWLKFMYNTPAGPIWNSWTQPYASQGTISYTPGIGRIPNTTGAPAGEKPPAQALTYDVQEYPSQKWGIGYIGAPVVFEKSSTKTANLNSLVFGVSYDWAMATNHKTFPKYKTKTPDVSSPWRLFLRAPDWRIQYGPELAVSTPHDLNVTAALTARLPIVINMPRQPSVITIFPVVGLEGGNHVGTHLPEPYPIFRKVVGYDSSLRVPFVATHAFFGDKPATIDFSWRTRYLSYNEPFTDFVSGYAERLTKVERSYWRGSYILPFSTLASFKVTAQHGGLPPDFDYLGYSVSVGLTLGNPGYSEH
jgi:hypothetical protein